MHRLTSGSCERFRTAGKIQSAERGRDPAIAGGGAGTAIAPQHRNGGNGEHTRLGAEGPEPQARLWTVLVEPFFDLKTPNAIARATGAEVLVLPPSVGGVKDASNYIALFDYDINLLITAIRKSGSD